MNKDEINRRIEDLLEQRFSVSDHWASDKLIQLVVGWLRSLRDGLSERTVSRSWDDFVRSTLLPAINEEEDSYEGIRMRAAKREDIPDITMAICAWRGNFPGEEDPENMMVGKEKRELLSFVEDLLSEMPRGTRYNIAPPENAIESFFWVNVSSPGTRGTYHLVDFTKEEGVLTCSLGRGATERVKEFADDVLVRVMGFRREGKHSYVRGGMSNG